MACAPDPSPTKTKKSLDCFICPICLETYKSPRSLPCLHTFCEGCLESYVTKQAQVSDTSSIACPLCRTETKPTDDTKPPAEWVRQLPLSNTTQQKNERKLCDPCSREGKSRPAKLFCRECAEYQCKDCIAAHSKFAVMKHHELVELTNALAIKLGRLVFCETHPNKLIEFYCSSHRIMFCCACAIVHQQVCRQVSEIKEFVKYDKNVKYGKQTKKLKTKMVLLQAQLGNAMSSMKANILDMENQAKSLPEKIVEIRDKIVKMCDDLLKRVSADSSKLKEAQSIKINEQIFKCGSLIAAITGSCILLESVLEHGTETEIFIVFHKLQDQVRQYEEMVKEAFKQSSTAELNLRIDTVVETLLKLGHSLPTVTVQETSFEKKFKPVAVPFAKWDYTKMPLFNVQINPFESLRYTGIVILPCGRVVAVDRQNRICCTLDDKCALLSHIDLEFKPRNLAAIGDTEVIVAKSEESQLQCVTVLPALTLTKTIQLRKIPACVASIDDTELAVGFVDSGFGIVTLDGKEKMFVNKDTEGREIEFDQRDRVAVDVTRNSFYQSCAVKDMVLSVELTGKRVFVYKNSKLSKPSGITLDKEGNVYVCSRATNGIHQISPTGALIRIMKTGMEEPYNICFFPHFQEMLVMNFLSKEKYQKQGSTQALQIKFEE